MAPSKKLSGDARASEGTSSSKKVPTTSNRKRKIIKTKIKKKNSNAKCIGCSKTFLTIYKLRLHKQKCNKLQENVEKNPEFFIIKTPLLPCKQCHKKFKFEKSLLSHIVEEHSEAPNCVQCSHCNVRCPDMVALQEHTTKVHERSLYECPHCNKTFVRAYHVQRHMKQKGCNGNAVSTMSCEICNTVFKRKDNLLVHLRSHLKSKKYKCKSCSYSTHSFSRYNTHVMKKHMPNKYECDYCGRVNSSRAAIAKHLEIHGEKKYGCEVCGYSTHTIEVIRRHVLRHTTDKPYKCELCPASFIQVLQLRKHLEKHVGNACSHCDKTFKTKARLTAHQRTHMGLKTLNCTVEGCLLANKAFPTEESLAEHLNSHDKKLSCEVCGKAFHSPVNLRRHTSTHALDRPRRCMYCVSARAYIRGEMLVRHVRVRHPAIFREHLTHVRQVMGYDNAEERVKKTEIESILNLLDAIADRIIEQNKGENVLYGGMQDSNKTVKVKKEERKPTLLNEEELVESLGKLIVQLIDMQTLELFGWPKETVDVILEKVLEQCGTNPADKGWSRVQRLRENAKHLFLHVIEDKTTSRMLETHTIDQVVMHILEVSEGKDDESEEGQKERADDETAKKGDLTEEDNDEEDLVEEDDEGADVAEEEEEEEDTEEGAQAQDNIEREQVYDYEILGDNVMFHLEEVEVEMEDKKEIIKVLPLR